MGNVRVASRYVKSLLSLAVEQGALEEVHEDMKLFSKVCRENRAFRLMLRSPVVRHDKKLEVLKKIFTGKVHALTMAIFDIITRKNREAILDVIASEFHIQYNKFKGISRATVTTATPLDAGLQKEMEALVKKISQLKEVELSTYVDPDMIGGFVLKVGDKQVDASLRSRLNALRIQFQKNPYVKEI